MKSLKERKFLQDIGITDLFRKTLWIAFQHTKQYRKKNSHFFHQQFHLYSFNVQWQNKLYYKKAWCLSSNTLILHDTELPWKTAGGDQYGNTWHPAKEAKKRWSNANEQRWWVKPGDLNPLVSKAYSRIRDLVSHPDSAALLPFQPLQDQDHSELMDRSCGTKMEGGKQYYFNKGRSKTYPGHLYWVNH